LRVACNGRLAYDGWVACDMWVACNVWLAYDGWVACDMWVAYQASVRASGADFCPGVPPFILAPLLTSSLFAFLPLCGSASFGGKG